MKKLIFLFLISSFLPIFSQQFHSLTGIEDQQGNTNLIYSIGIDLYDQYNSVYKYNINTGLESFIIDANHYMDANFDFTTLQAKSNVDFEFFPNNTNNFINVGFISNYNSTYGYAAKNDIIKTEKPFLMRIDISKQDPNKVIISGGENYRSFDGGDTFQEDTTIHLNFLSMADFDDKVIFGTISNETFVKSEDNGTTYSIVDTSKVVSGMPFLKFYYDANKNYIYRQNRSYNKFVLNLSTNKGNAGSWSRIYDSDHPFYVTIDSTQSGVVYLADKKQISKSTDAGITFIPYRSMSSELVGIYKKPNSEILYAASLDTIFKITPTTIEVIKSHNFNNDILLTNSYIYVKTATDSGSVRIINKSDNSIRIDSIISTGSFYGYHGKFTKPGFVFPFYLFQTVPGFMGDTLGIIIPPHEYINVFFYDVDLCPLCMQEVLNNFKDTLRFVFSYSGNSGQSFSKSIPIKGEGHLSDVNEENGIPTEFSLSQNYPNPFNPSTNIQYSISSRQFVTLKVFDVLGKEVATLVNEDREVGSYNVEFTMNNLQLSSGIYFYQLKAGTFVETKKMILLK